MFKCIMAKTCPSVLPYILSQEEHLIQILYRGSLTGNLYMFSDIEDSKKYALDPFFKFVGFVHRIEDARSSIQHLAGLKFSFSLGAS